MKTELKRVQEDTEKYRFIEKTGEMRMFAYLITSPLEPTYKPFESVEQVKVAIQKHGGWVEHKTMISIFLIIGIEDTGCYLGDADYYSFEELLQNFVFTDDESPCGELVEE